MFHEAAEKGTITFGENHQIWIWVNSLDGFLWFFMGFLDPQKIHQTCFFGHEELLPIVDQPRWTPIYTFYTNLVSLYNPQFKGYPNSIHGYPNFPSQFHLVNGHFVANLSKFSSVHPLVKLVQGADRGQCGWPRCRRWVQWVDRRSGETSMTYNKNHNNHTDSNSDHS